MSRQLLAMALAPLLGLFILGIGNGFLATVITLRLDAAGESPVVIGWVSSAYFVGRKFGKTKLAPRISPKKTLEGSAGGLTASVVGAVIMSFFLAGLGVVDAVALGILAGAAGQAGDLLMSVLKRSSGVKDSGGILPGR